MSFPEHITRSELKSAKDAKLNLCIATASYMQGRSKDPALKLWWSEELRALKEEQAEREVKAK